MAGDSLFVTGARVAVTHGRGGPITEAVVDKVHKNGNFTLRGSPQQWRPFGRGARKTGRESSWSQERARLWDAETDAEITAAIASHKRGVRLAEIIRRLNRTGSGDITEAALDQIEAALPQTMEASNGR